jgi:hypothetical protein
MAAGFGPAEPNAACACPGGSSIDAAADHVPFEFREGPGYMEEHATGWAS